MSELSILVQGEGPLHLWPILRDALSDSWVGSYQVGFGPPLVGATADLRTQVRQARSALEKLELYLNHCLLDPPTRRRLSGLHRRLVIRRAGPQEAEALDRAASEALDLRMRLRLPDSPPPELDLATWQALPWPSDPMSAEAQFLVRLDDPFGKRWQRERHEEQLWVELRVDAPAHPVWARWAEDWSRRTGWRVDLRREPISHAPRILNGVPVD